MNHIQWLQVQHLLVFNINIIIMLAQEIEILPATMMATILAISIGKMHPHHCTVMAWSGLLVSSQMSSHRHEREQTIRQTSQFTYNSAMTISSTWLPCTVNMVQELHSVHSGKEPRSFQSSSPSTRRRCKRQLQAGETCKQLPVSNTSFLQQDVQHQLPTYLPTSGG